MLNAYHIPIIGIYLIIITLILYRCLSEKKGVLEIVCIIIASFFIYYYYASSILPIPIEKITLDLFKEVNNNIVNLKPFNFLLSMYFNGSLNELIKYILIRVVCLLPIGFLIGYIYRKYSMYIKLFIAVMIPFISLIIKIGLSLLFNYVFKNIVVDDLLLEACIIGLGVILFNLWNLVSNKIIKKLKKGSRNECYWSKIPL